MGVLVPPFLGPCAIVTWHHADGLLDCQHVFADGIRLQLCILAEFSDAHDQQESTDSGQSLLST